MTNTDLQRIEQTLSLKLPADYRQLLIDYPFAEDSFAHDCMLFRDAESLIKSNPHLVSAPAIQPEKGRWSPQRNHFLIGNDGGETRYYLDLSDPACRILKYDLESGQASPYAKDIAEFKALVLQMDREIADEEARFEKASQEAKWWQFWKK